MLVICDIDETVLMFENDNQCISTNWWETRKKYYIDNHNHNYDSAQDVSYEDWLEIVNNNKPKFTDKDGFLSMLKKIEETDSTIIFLTARDQNIKELTYKHFKELDLDPNNYKIYFTNHSAKGRFIKSNININKYNKVIFIDDLLNNLDSVSNEYNDQISYYQFNLIN